MRTSIFIILLVLLLGSTGTTEAQRNTSLLQNYVQQGLANNLVLKQKQVEAEKALLALAYAKALFLPDITGQLGYQTGGGGRSISIPVGDLLNPVYSTLNQLTASSHFPQISNSTSNFLPSHFGDAKITASIPIYNPGLQINRKICEIQTSISKSEISRYQRELIHEIKSAYYHLCYAHEAIGIYQAAAELAREGLRTNQRLLSNGKGLPAYILRAESEVTQYEAAVFEAGKQEENARTYLNMLLNNPAGTPLQVEPLQNADDSLQLQAEQQREEITQLKQSVTARQQFLRLQQQFNKPVIHLFSNWGTQAEKMKFTGSSFYYLAGVQLEIPLFQGKRNLVKIKQAEQEVKLAEFQLSDTKNQLETAQKIAANKVLVARRDYESALLQSQTAAAYQRLIDKGFREGVNSFLETVDARTQYIQAQIHVNLKRLNRMLAAADYEREFATYSLPTAQ